MLKVNTPTRKTDVWGTQGLLCTLRPGATRPGN
jgi:hypothetical protein